MEIFLSASELGHEIDFSFVPEREANFKVFPHRELPHTIVEVSSQHFLTAATSVQCEGVSVCMLEFEEICFPLTIETKWFTFMNYFFHVSLSKEKKKLFRFFCSFFFYYFRREF